MNYQMQYMITSLYQLLEYVSYYLPLHCLQVHKIVIFKIMLPYLTV